MSYKSATEQLVNEKEEIKPFRLATVSALFDDGCPKITFFGEETPSEKKYKVIEGTSYSVGNTVLVGIVNDGYVVLGTINYYANGGSTSGYLTLDEAKQLFAAKDHTHSNYAASSHSHSSYASTSHAHSDYANSDHKHNKLYTNPSSSGGGSSLTLSDSGLIPTSTWSPPLGNTTYKYGQIYSTNSVISTSDRRKKEQIEPLDERYMKLFRLLRPKRYKFKDGKSNRYHIGLISQDVEKALKEAGLTDSDFAGFIKSPRLGKNGKQVKGYDYGLRYEEFIPINAMVLQMVLDMVEEQADYIKDQDRRLEQLERRLIDEQDISNQP